MISESIIRGSRVGAGPMGEADRGECAARVWVSFWCANRHETRPSFAADAVIPELWECPRCGGPAGRDKQEPPAGPRDEPYKTHLAYVKERRSQSEGEAILAEALVRRRGAAAPRPPVPGPPLTARAVDGEGQRDLGGRQEADNDDLPAAAPAAAPPAADTRDHSDEAQEPHDLGGRQEADDDDLPADDTPDPALANRAHDVSPEPAHIGAAQRQSPKTPRRRTDSALPDPPADEWCAKCTYKLTAPGHKSTCLGQ